MSRNQSIWNQQILTHFLNLICPKEYVQNIRRIYEYVKNIFLQYLFAEFVSVSSRISNPRKKSTPKCLNDVEEKLQILTV